MPFADVVIVGSGIAALSAARKLSPYKNVIIITKSKKENSNSMLAQGGVSAAVDQDDCWQDHFEDTILAGCHHNDDDIVKLLVKNGPDHIRDLIENGMEFDRSENGTLHLGQEGAHNRRRILHAGGDATGKELTSFLFKNMQNTIKIIENEMALDLIVEDGRCVGLYTMNEAGIVNSYHASHVILATGGCGSLYKVSSNDSNIIGDGLAMAYRAGAVLTDLEFIQFHPTMLYANGKRSGLISEAVRGEGAILVSESGRRIMKDVHMLQDLAPRDIVARAIQKEQQQGRNVFLDISMITDFKERFPTITSICESAGINIETGLLPVSPGAHFLMGGIKTNSNGQTSVPGLYAVGEVACTGVHGANRLASNSLLEGMVFGTLLADFILKQKASLRITAQSNHPVSKKTSVIEYSYPAKTEIQEVMMSFVGIERNYEGLQTAKQWVEQFINRDLLRSRMSTFTKEEVEAVNMLTNCWLIITSAIMRTESRGGHYRSDYPISQKIWQNVQLLRHRDEVITHEQEAMAGVK